MALLNTIKPFVFPIMLVVIGAINSILAIAAVQQQGIFYTAEDPYLRWQSIFNASLMLLGIIAAFFVVLKEDERVEM
jgi:hypothetical membrane protein